MNFLSSNSIRWFLFQVLALVLILGFIYHIYDNTVANITDRGLRVGFDFLSVEAGFDIAESLIDYQESDNYTRVFLVGIVNTLYVAFVAIIFSSILGLIIGIARFSNNWLVRKLSSAYVEVFRNIPVLLQIIFWHNLLINFAPNVRESIVFFDNIYFNLRGIFLPKIVQTDSLFYLIATITIVFISLFLLYKNKKKIHYVVYRLVQLFLMVLPFVVYFLLGNMTVEVPKLAGFNFQGGFSISPEFFALTFALSIYTATYIAESVRAGIEAISKGQKEAASSLGLNSQQVLKFVVLPQALRVAVPPIISQYLNVTKNSSLAVAIGYPDLVSVFTGTTLNQVGQALEIVAMTMLVYLLISLFISLALNWVNAKLAIKER